MGGLKVSLVVSMGLMIMYDGYSLAERPSASALMFVQNGLASWYGREEQGKPTASGETFNRHRFTAASRHLPFNTLVRVTNENNGRTVDVRINDRGPFVKGRILDLSEAAADTLDMKKSGTAPVKIEVVAPSSAQAPAAP
jgi:rare lipoprotein A